MGFLTLNVTRDRTKYRGYLLNEISTSQIKQQGRDRKNELKKDNLEIIISCGWVLLGNEPQMQSNTRQTVDDTAAS